MTQIAQRLVAVFVAVSAYVISMGPLTEAFARIVA